MVALTLFDLRRLGKVRLILHPSVPPFLTSNPIAQVDKLGICGADGRRFPAVRKHLDENIGGVYKDMDTSYVPLLTPPS